MRRFRARRSLRTSRKRSYASTTAAGSSRLAIPRVHPRGVGAQRPDAQASPASRRRRRNWRDGRVLVEHMYERNYAAPGTRPSCASASQAFLRGTTRSTSTVCGHPSSALAAATGTSIGGGLLRPARPALRRDPGRQARARPWLQCRVLVARGDRGGRRLRHRCRRASDARRPGKPRLRGEAHCDRPLSLSTGRRLQPRCFRGGRLRRRALPGSPVEGGRRTAGALRLSRREDAAAALHELEAVGLLPQRNRRAFIAAKGLCFMASTPSRSAQARGAPRAGSSGHGSERSGGGCGAQARETTHVEDPPDEDHSAHGRPCRSSAVPVTACSLLHCARATLTAQGQHDRRKRAAVRGGDAGTTLEGSGRVPAA
jgi:hypothetical protein